MSRRSIGFPLTIGIVLTTIALALAVGWQFLVVADLRPVARGLTTAHWLLLILGGLFFLLLILGLALLCAWLIREMRINQRQQAFLDAVTHEMKTPLASLRLYLETLLRHDPEADRRGQFLSSMEEDLQRLDRTVIQVLAAARAEERNREPVLERIALPTLLEECIAEVTRGHDLPDRAIRLYTSGSVSVEGRREELALVFRNLLENAVKYSEAPAEVRVRVAPDGTGRVSVGIQDRGIGIPPKELRKIFTRFYRAGRDVQRKVAGLGLGLFIVRHLVRRQGGRVVAESAGAGQGSRFVVTLPKAPEQEAKGLATAASL